MFEPSANSSHCKKYDLQNEQFMIDHILKIYIQFFLFRVRNCIFRFGLAVQYSTLVSLAGFESRMDRSFSFLIFCKFYFEKYCFLAVFRLYSLSEKSVHENCSKLQRGIAVCTRTAARTRSGGAPGLAAMSDIFFLKLCQ